MTEINGLPQTSPVKRRLAVVVLVTLCALGVGGITYAVVKNSEKTDELCSFVDADHNADRAAIVKQEHETFNPPPSTPASIRAFLEPLTDELAERQSIHRNNRRKYNLVRDTRPSYCSDVRENPVKPYPALKEIEKP